MAMIDLRRNRDWGSDGRQIDCSSVTVQWANGRLSVLAVGRLNVPLVQYF